MNSQEQNKFKELISVISETYGEEFTQAKLKLWWNLFKPYSIVTFEQALYSHIACPDTGMFAPKPANITKFINGTTKQAERLIEDRAEMAWQVIEGEISRVGSYGTLKMEDKQALAAVQAIGGWQKLCATQTDKMAWTHKEFVAAYQNFERTPIEALPNKLPGRVHLVNHKKQQPESAFIKGLQDFRNRIGKE